MNQEFSNLIKASFDILRSDNASNINDKAINTLNFLLVYRSLEILINNNELNLNNFNYDLGDNDNQLKEKLLSYTKITNLINEDEAHIDKFKYMWEYILQQNPKTNHIFGNVNDFIMKHNSYFITIIKKFSEIDLTQIDDDLIGTIYEQVLSYKGNSARTLGQFFTLSPLKKLMIEITKPKLKPSRLCEKIYDPAMGTGGFLISAISYLKQQAIEQNINIDWKNIIHKNLISGCEIENDTYKLACSNLFLSTGHLFNRLEHNDSIRNPTINSMDVVLANPPFGISINYNDLNDEFKNSYYPIKHNNCVILFIQLIIYILRINGRCAIVVPAGEILNSNNASIIKFREYLFKTCDIKEIYCLKGDKKKFSNTGVETCILYFEKRKTYNDIFDKKVRTKIEFKNEYATISTTFYEYNCDTQEKKILVVANQEELIENKYNLNAKTYIKQEIIQIDNNIEYKKIKDIFKFKKGTIQSSKVIEDEDGYIFVTGAKSHTWKKIKQETYTKYNDEGLFISHWGNGDKVPISYYTGEYLYSDLMMKLIPINNNINLKFYYYYFKYIQEYIENNFQKGSCNKSLDVELFNEYKIPIPSIQVQNNIVKYFETIEKTNEINKQNIENLKQLNKDYIITYIDRLEIRDRIKIKNFEDILKINGSGNTNSSDMSNSGNIPFYKAANINPSGFHNDYDFNNEEYLLFIKSGGSASNPISETHGIGKVYYVKGLSAANIAVFQLLNISNNNLKYIYYYLLFNKTKIQLLANYTTNNGNIDMKQLLKFKIPIPSLYVQNKIVEYCDKNVKLIQSLEENIETNKKIMKDYLKNKFENNEEEAFSDED